jgi:hypothetical protein
MIGPAGSSAANASLLEDTLIDETGEPESPDIFENQSEWEEFREQGELELDESRTEESKQLTTTSSCAKSPSKT